MTKMSEEEFANICEEMAKPIDFDELVEIGALKRNGKSYYLLDLNKLPEHVTRKIKSMGQTKQGIKLTFYK